MRKRPFFRYSIVLASCLASCSGPQPEPEYKEYVVVKVETAYDHTLQRAQPRTILERVPLDSLPGFNGQQYAQAKTFSLPDTNTYRVGTHVWAESHVVAYGQQTPLRTRYEWLSTSQQPPGYVPYPELLLGRPTPR